MITIPDLHAAKAQGRPLAMLTAYDATFARLFDEAGVDMMLVGDSLGNVIQGHDATLPVTLEDILYHTRAVVRATKNAHIVADMPFLSYGADEAEAVRNAGRLMKEGGAHAVKLEGAGELLGAIRRMVGIGIPVMGHLGLTPQSVHALGGYKVQGRGEAGDRLLEDALALEGAGVYALVLEMVPATLAARVSQALRVPVIGIGAGAHTDGQVLVCYDMLGLNRGFQPRFLKRFETLGERVEEAVRAYIAEVRARSFPGVEHSFGDR
mgnify:CR=1 FL=1